MGGLLEHFNGISPGRHFEVSDEQVIWRIRCGLCFLARSSHASASPNYKLALAYINAGSFALAQVTKHALV